MDILVASRLISAVLGIYVFLTSVELLVNRKAIAPSGLLDWNILRLSSPSNANPFFRSAVDFFLAYPNILILLGLRTLLGIALVGNFLLPEMAYVICLFSVTVCQICLAFRHRFGGDGAEQMALIVLVTLSLGHAVMSNSGLIYAIAFIAFQSLLAYTTSGLAKLCSPTWRGGKALIGIIRTELFKCLWFENLIVRQPSMQLLMSWTAIVSLLVVLPAFFVGGQVLLLALSILAFFHVANALILRLHTFVWVFISTYPAIWYVRESLLKGIT